MPAQTPSRLIEVRATIHLPRLNVGAVAVVDPDDEYIAELLAASYLVATGRAVPETPPATGA